MQPKTQREIAFADQLVQTETIAANAVQELDRKVQEAKMWLRAAALSNGGELVIDDHAIQSALDADWEMIRDEKSMRFILKVKRS